MRFEKESNFDNKSVDTNDWWVENDFYEIYSWAWSASWITVSGWTYVY